MTAWLAVVAIGVGSFLTRLSFIAMLGRIEVPEWLDRSLKFVAPAVLAALVTPAVLVADGSIDLTVSNGRWWAALLAGLAAWRTRNVAATIVVGMGALWVLQAI